MLIVTLSLPTVGLHNHRWDSHRADEKQADDQGQRLDIFTLVAHLPFSAASPSSTHPQAKAGSAAGGFRKRWVCVDLPPSMMSLIHRFSSTTAVYICFNLLLSPGSVFCWLLPLHSSPPSVGGITYSALPDYDVWRMARKVLSVWLSECIFCLTTMSYLWTWEMKEDEGRDWDEWREYACLDEWMNGWMLCAVFVCVTLSPRA